MADGKVKIDVDLDEKEAKQGLDNLGEAADDAAKDVDELGEKAKKTGDAVEDLGDKSDKSSKGFDLLDIAAGNLVAGGISALISGIGEAISSLVSMAEETREFRDDMAKLNTAFETAGHSSEAASKVYEDFYAILGESDRSVEAVNHLAELTDNTEDLSKWSKIAAGVTAKFGDSLPIEGLTEAANETAKVGQTTGVLADALNWASKDSAVFKTALGGNQKALSAFNKALKDGENVEDAFTAALGKMSTEQERSAAITNTLSGLYDEAAQQYNEMTASTQAARRATAEMEQAQARLGAAFEPLSTIVTEAKTAFFNFAATMAEDVAISIDKTREAATGLNSEQRALVENALEAASALQTLREASAENADGINTQFDHTQKLANELFTLADANGVVEDAERERVEFILGELKTALGEEYTLVGNQIQQYNGLRESINEAIAAERARLLLAEYQDDYVEALRASAEQEKAISAEREAMYQTYSELEDLRSKEKQARIAYDQAVEDGASFHTLQRLGSELTSFEKATRNKELLYDKQVEKLGELGEAHKKSTDLITAVEEAKGAVLAGETEKGLDLINNLDSAIKGSTDKTIDEYEKQKVAAREKVIDTSVQLGLLEAEYKETQGNMTKAEEKEMLKRIENAKKQAQDAREEYYAVGGSHIEGLVKGVEDKDGQPQWNLSGVLSRIVQDGINKAKEVAGINSPSKEFAWIGEMQMEGLVVGTKHGGKKAVEAVRNVGADMVKEGQKTAEKNVKTIEDELDKIADLRDAANKKLSKLDNKKNAKQKEQLKKEIENLDEKKKLAQKELEIAREREKTMSSFATKYEKHLSDLKKLEEDYNKAHQGIFDKLKTDSEKALADYETTFANRVNSIRGSLGLFDIVEKKESASGSEMSKALRSQVTELEKYNEALTTLFNRSGVTAAFYEEFSALGVGYLPQLEAINKMSDEQLSEYVALWEEKTALASQAAEKELAGERGRLNSELAQLKTDALKEAELLKTEYNGAMLELLGEITGGMLNAGNAGIEALGETVSGYVEAGAALMEGVAQGMESKQSEIIQQAVSAVRAAISAAKAEADINSPSRVTKDEIGANLALGVAEGWEDKLSKLRGSMSAGLSGITDRLRETVNAENARYGFSHGAPDTGFTELARAVNVQTAGINSLASAQRGGSSRPVVLMLDKRELGSAVVDVGSAETVRVGTKLITGGAR